MKHGMERAWVQGGTVQSTGRLPFAPSKVELQGQWHVRDPLHALFDLHAEIETAAFPSPGGTFRGSTGPSTPSKEAVEIALGGQPSSSSPLAPHCNTRAHWRARELRRLLPKLLAWTIFCAFPLTLVSRLKPGRAGQSPFCHMCGSFWASKARYIGVRHGGIWSRQSLLGYARPFDPISRSRSRDAGVGGRYWGRIDRCPIRALGLLEALLKREAAGS
ncbi:hypothetical protein J3F83DRAFT_737754 [Trichoderma novae-zelandiae]